MRACGCLILLALAGNPVAAADAADSSIAPFSVASPGAQLPAPWRISTVPNVKRATHYALVADGETVVLRAQGQCLHGERHACIED